ncbi:hypothetical protein [Nocardia sp. N2S4-5]|uniref:hypothetical protein n=1 Tax=Nocardia sp. N2S4-5 TaxID=3351565 RepID=UPI0037D98F77
MYSSNAMSSAARKAVVVAVLSAGVLGTVGTGVAAAKVTVTVTCPVFLNTFGQPGGAIQSTGTGDTTGAAVQDARVKAQKTASEHGGYVNPDLCK